MKDKGHTNEHKLMKKSDPSKNREERLLMDLGKTTGIWNWMDVNSNVQWWSPKFYELLGYEDGEIAASVSGFRALLHPNDQKKIWNSIEIHLKNEIRYETELQLKTKSGEYKWFLNCGQAISDDSGRPTGMLNTIIDIDEKKKLQELLGRINSFERIGGWEYIIADHKVTWTSGTKSIFEVPTDFEPNINTALGFYKEGESRHTIAKVMEEAINEAKTYDVQTLIVTAKGHERWIRSSGLPVFVDGTCVKLVGKIHDIHKQKLQDIKLAESEERYRLLADNMQGTVCTHELDGSYNYVSPSFEQNFGYSSNEVLGKKPIDFIHKEDISPLTTLLNDLLDGGNLNKSIELRMKCKDGDYLWVRLKAYIINIQGETTGLQTETNIIQESKEYEQKLAKITDRFTTSLEAAQIGIWDWDVLTNSLVWDKLMYNIYGISKDIFSANFEVWQSGLHPDDAERSRNEVQLALSGEKNLDTDFRIIWPDKSIHHIRALAKVERDEAGNPIRMIGANWDITKVKESEALKIQSKSLEIKNKELEQFAYVASHDLQEPLRTVSSFVDLLLTNYKDRLDDQGVQILSYITASSERMKALVSGLLDYSRIGRKVELKKVDCQKIVHQVIEDFSLVIEESGAKITVAKLPRLVGYETELRMVFQNLISNAIKFRKESEGLKIKISAVKQENHDWLFTVQDNGIGIEEQHKDRIFLIFQRLHTRNKYDGTGIGLAHCKKIIEMHQGKIWMKSTLNKGTTFFFTIPYLKHEK